MHEVDTDASVSLQADQLLVLDLAENLPTPAGFVMCFCFEDEVSLTVLDASAIVIGLAIVAWPG